MLSYQTRFLVIHSSTHLIISGVFSHFSGQLAGIWQTTLKPQLWLDNTLTCATLIVAMISEQGCLISFIRLVSVEIYIWAATSIPGFLKSHQKKKANVCVGGFLLGTKKKRIISVAYFWIIYNTTHLELHSELQYNAAVLIIHVENVTYSSPLRGGFMTRMWISLLIAIFNANLTSSGSGWSLEGLI